MVTGIKDNLGGWILMLKAITHLRQLLKFCCMEAINDGGFLCVFIYLFIIWLSSCLF